MFKGPRAGEMDVRVQLYVPNLTADMMGGESVSWVQSGAFWAKVRAFKPTKREEAGTEHYGQDVEVTARYEAPGRVGDRLMINNEPFMIFAVKNPDMKNAYKQFHCTSTSLEMD